MADYSRMYANRNINNRKSQYNNVRHEGVSFSDIAATAAERARDAARERERRLARERASAPVIVKKRVKASPFPVSFVFYALVVTVMLMFVVYSYSVVNEISYDITSLEEKISESKQENERLAIELDKRNDLKYIEEVATTRLGMVKSTDVVKHYVSISGGDKVVLSEDNAKGTALGVTLDSLKDSVGKIYN